MKTGKSKDHLQRVFLRFLYLIMGSILSLDSVMAQENLKVSGQVTDNKGEAIIGASVKVLKTGTGTISDMDGKFTIQVPVGAELEIGYVGYNPKRVKVVNKNFVTVVLEENVVALGDVVVVGYGIQKKESLTGAIGNLKVDDIVKTKAPSLAQAIQGKVAGLPALISASFRMVIYCPALAISGTLVGEVMPTLAFNVIRGLPVAPFLVVTITAPFAEFIP